MGRGNAKQLTDEQQRFAVGLLACFRTPSEVAQALKEQYRIKVSRQLVEHYDPFKEAGKNLHSDLKKLFDEARTQYLETTNRIGVAHQVYRLDRLQEALEQALESGNVVEVRELLKQAAQERGGLFTNKREVKVDAQKSLAELLGVAPDELPADTDGNAQS